MFDLFFLKDQFCVNKVNLGCLDLTKCNRCWRLQMIWKGLCTRYQQMKKCYLLQKIHYIVEISFWRRFFPFELWNYQAIIVYSSKVFLLLHVTYEQVNYFMCLFHYIKRNSQTRSYKKSYQFFIGLFHIQFLICC